MRKVTRQDLHASSERRFFSSDRVTLISWSASGKLQSRACKALSAEAIILTIDLASKALQQYDFVWITHDRPLTSTTIFPSPRTFS